MLRPHLEVAPPHCVLRAREQGDPPRSEIARQVIPFAWPSVVACSAPFLKSHLYAVLSCEPVKRAHSRSQTAKQSIRPKRPSMAACSVPVWRSHLLAVLSCEPVKRMPSESETAKQVMMSTALHYRVAALPRL